MSSKWKELSEELQSQDDSAVLQALGQLSLHDKSLGKDATKKILPPIIKRLDHPDLTIRAAAMSVLSKQLTLENSSMSSIAEDLCKRIVQPELLNLKHNRDQAENYEKFHTSMCSAICELQRRYPRKILPHFKQLGVYLVECSCYHGNKAIAAAGCQYWAKLEVPPVPDRYMDIWIPSILSKLQRLVPGLLTCMVYHPEHIQYKKDKQEQQESTTPRLEHLSNVRNFAALGFENLCKIFPTEVIAIFKPVLAKSLSSEDWVVIEATTLALGAFTEAVGRPKEMRNVYPTLIPQIMEQFKHPEPLVRAITCFTMQHFINFTMKGVKDPLPKVIKCTIALMSDELLETRLMAIQTLTSTLAYSQRDLSPYSEKIADALIKYSQTMTGEAVGGYYDCVGHLFGRMNDILEDQSITSLMQPFIDHWQRLDWNDLTEKKVEDTIMLCQPMTIIASYAKTTFTRYNEIIFSKVSADISAILARSSSEKSSQHLNDYIIALLDTASAVFEGQGSEMCSLASKYKFEQWTLNILQDKNFSDKTHQSILALLGHLSNLCFGGLEPCVDEIITICSQRLCSTEDNIKNNALWTVMGIAKNIPGKNKKLLAMSEQIAQILISAESNHGQAVNAALALTHMGRHRSKDLINLITREDVFMMICTLLQMEFQRDLEKATIFTNLCVIMEEHLRKLPKDIWAPFCTAIALCDCADDDLTQLLKTFLKNLRTAVGDSGWSKIYNQLGPQLAVTLRKKYQLY